MKKIFLVSLSVLAGVLIGSGLMQTLHAQAKAPVYWIASIDVSNQDAYTKEFAPLAAAVFAAHGAKYIVRGKVRGLEGVTPDRFVIVQFPDMQSAEAAYQSTEYKDARKISDKYAKFTMLVLADGVSP
jgi:uncharacterized protein (DUF1330 family)